MPVMIPMVQTFQWERIKRVSGESESRMLWGVVVKELRAPVIWSRLTFMEHFQSRTMFRNFVSHPVSTFIRIKDLRPSKTLFSRNALKWVFIQILSVSGWFRLQTQCQLIVGPSPDKTWPKSDPRHSPRTRPSVTSDHFKAERLLNISLRLFLDQMIILG